MKKAYLILLLVAPLFVGCSSDDLEDLTTVSSDVELSEQFDIQIPPGTSAFTFSETFDASQEDGFSKFENKIDDITVTSVTYEILSVEENPNNAVIESGQLVFVDGSNEFVLGDITGLNINNNVGNPIELSVNQSVLDAMEAKFRSEGKITVEATVQVSDTPVSFDLEVIMNLNVSGSIVN